jgi:hypothetical protein
MTFILVSDIKIIHQTLKINICTFLGSDTCDNEQYEMWYEMLQILSVQLKSGPYFNISNLFTKIYNMLYYTTNLYLQ